MEVTEEYAALILLSAAQSIIRKRRKLEMMCGYDAEYGGDELLLKRIDQFMENTNIKHELKEALAFKTKWDKGGNGDTTGK